MTPIDRLRDLLSRHRPLAVAFSGGVDSSCLLAAARDVLGDDVLAVTGVSPSLATHQLEQARRVAADLDARHVFILTDEMGNEEYRSNPGNRCFFCKDELYGRLRATLGDAWPNVADGTNTDDLGDFRPGREAAARHSVFSPFVEAGLDKEAIRRLSRHYALETSELPASPCLASRIPHGRPVTVETLARIERAEAALRALGIRELRVRHFGDHGRVEIGAAESPRARTTEQREAMIAAVKAAGFRTALIDPRPLRSGRLNGESSSLR